MNINSFNIAYSGIVASENIAIEATKKINTDLNTAAVELIQSEVQAKANIKSIETINETIGSIIDLNV